MGYESHYLIIPNQMDVKIQLGVRYMENDNKENHHDFY